MAEEKKGFFKRLVSGLAKTRDNIVAGFDSIFSGFSSIDEDFYEEIIPILRLCIQNMKNELEKLPILKPYSFVLIDEDKETISDLYLVDDDTLIFDDELLKGLDEELDEFLKKLLSE